MSSEYINSAIEFRVNLLASHHTNNQMEILPKIAMLSILAIWIAKSMTLDF